jgi:hypothetical protein
MKSHLEVFWVYSGGVKPHPELYRLTVEPRRLTLKLCGLTLVLWRFIKQLWMLILVLWRLTLSLQRLTHGIVEDHPRAIEALPEPWRSSWSCGGPS